MEEDNPKAANFSPARRAMSVSCENRVWKVTVYGEDWSGPVEELENVSLAFSKADTGNDFAAYAYRAAMENAHFDLQFDGTMFQVRSNRVARVRHPASDGPHQLHEVSDFVGGGQRIRVPAGYDGYGISYQGNQKIEYFKRIFRLGFRTFRMEPVKTDTEQE